MLGSKILPDMKSSVSMPNVTTSNNKNNCETCSHREVCKMKDCRSKLQADILEKKQSSEYSEFDVHVGCKYYESRPYTILR